MIDLAEPELDVDSREAVVDGGPVYNVHDDQREVDGHECLQGLPPGWFTEGEILRLVEPRFHRADVIPLGSSKRSARPEPGPMAEGIVFAATGGSIVLFELFGDLNWLAVIVAALAYWILGAIWFSKALFQDQWQAATGVEMGQPTATQIVGNLVTWFVSALALALIAEGTMADNAWDGIVLGFVASVGFIGMNRITEALYTGWANKALMKINAPYTLLGFIVMGIILSTWT